MATKPITIEYEFSSTKADGDPYTRRLVLNARNEMAALSQAKLAGFEAFGARFTDNCVDWRIVKEAQP